MEAYDFPRLKEHYKEQSNKFNKEVISKPQLPSLIGDFLSLNAFLVELSLMAFMLITYILGIRIMETLCLGNSSRSIYP